MPAALRLSLLAAGTATLIVVLVGAAGGWLLARRRFPGRELLDAALMLPLVLPPTVTGYYLLVLLGRHGPIGRPLTELFGVTVPFSAAACVIAAAVMSFPLMLRAARVAFEELDRSHETAAASLGHGPWSVWWRISLPLARRGLLAGAVLAFARALGEFGATMMLAGNIPGRTQTLPLAIYEAALTGDDRTALWLSLLLTALSVAVLLISGRLARRLP